MLKSKINYNKERENYKKVLRIKLINRLTLAVIFTAIILSLAYIGLFKNPSITGFVTITNISEGCTVPTENLTLNESVTFCSGSYNFSSYDTNKGIININNPNIIITCNNTELFGDATGQFVILNQSNISIVNCKISKFDICIKVDADNINFNNLTLHNCSTSGIIIQDSDGINLTENNFSNQNSGLKIMNSSNITVNRNVFMNLNNSINFASINIMQFSSRIYITNNYIYNANRGITTSGYSRDIYLFNNTIDLNDIGIMINEFTTNISIDSNLINNSIMNYDWYNVGIFISYRNRLVSVSSNNIFNYGGSGVLIQRSNPYYELAIRNNTFSQMPDNEKISRKIADYFEPPAAISILEIYRGWLGDGDETLEDNLTNRIFQYASSNISISNNNFSNDTVKTYLRLQGTQSVTHDIENLNPWYRNFQTPLYLVDNDEFYNNINFDELVALHNPLNSTISNYFIKSYAMGGWYEEPFPPYAMIKYTISKDNLSFKNIQNTNTFDLIISNKSRLGSSKDIYDYTHNRLLKSASDEFNITLQPNQKIIIADYPDDWISSCTLSDISMNENTNLTDEINLTDCFDDPLNASLNYSAVNNSNINITILNGSVSFYPLEDYEGTEYVYFTANDTNRSTFTNTISITINHVVSCADSICESPETCSTCPADCGSCPSSGGGGGGSTRPPPVIPVANDTVNESINLSINESVNLTINETVNITPTNETNLTIEVEPEPEPTVEEPTDVEEPKDNLIVTPVETTKPEEDKTLEPSGLAGGAMQQEGTIVWKGITSVWISVFTMALIAGLVITTLAIRTNKKIDPQLATVLLDKRILELHQKGYSEADTKTKLIQEGYSASEINLEHHTNYYIMLEQWIGAARSKGLTEDRMAELLKDKGWSKSVIREILRK